MGLADFEHSKRPVVESFSADAGWSFRADFAPLSLIAAQQAEGRPEAVIDALAL